MRIRVSARSFRCHCLAVTDRRLASTVHEVEAFGPDATLMPTTCIRLCSWPSVVSRFGRNERSTCPTREFFPELAQLQHGTRSVLHRHSERTMVLHFPPDLLVDVDTPDDYELAKSRLSSGL